MTEQRDNGEPVVEAPLISVSAALGFKAGNQPQHPIAVDEPQGPGSDDVGASHQGCAVSAISAKRTDAG